MGYSFGTMQIQNQLVYQFIGGFYEISTEMSFQWKCEWNARCVLNHIRAALERHRIERIGSGKSATDAIINNNLAFAVGALDPSDLLVAAPPWELWSMHVMCARDMLLRPVDENCWPFVPCLCEQRICFQFVAIQFDSPAKICCTCGFPITRLPAFTPENCDFNLAGQWSHLHRQNVFIHFNLSHFFRCTTMHKKKTRKFILIMVGPTSLSETMHRAYSALLSTYMIAWKRQRKCNGGGGNTNTDALWPADGDRWLTYHILATRSAAASVWIDFHFFLRLQCQLIHSFATPNTYRNVTIYFCWWPCLRNCLSAYVLAAHCLFCMHLGTKTEHDTKTDFQ